MRTSARQLEARQLEARQLEARQLEARQLEARQLEARQHSLVAALVAGADPPAGLDGDRIRVQAAALVRKRARAVARAQPELAAALGPAFGPAFRAYVHSSPWATPGCTAADAEEFARYLRDSSQPREVRRAARRVTRRWPP